MKIIPLQSSRIITESSIIIKYSYNIHPLFRSISSFHLYYYKTNEKIISSLMLNATSYFSLELLPFLLFFIIYFTSSLRASSSSSPSPLSPRPKVTSPLPFPSDSSPSLKKQLYLLPSFFNFHPLPLSYGLFSSLITPHPFICLIIQLLPSPIPPPPLIHLS